MTFRGAMSVGSVLPVPPAHHIRFRRYAAFLLAVGTLLAGLGLGSAVPAHAATAGCPDANGVSVVVDLRQLGGGILERCAPGLNANSTGLDALSKAGIPYEGTSQWGDAFICRLVGRPAADESLRIPGNSNYHERCISTPPQSAYWAYWWAPNGGPWHYSNAGVSSHRITPGGFEGWVFTLDGADSAPGVAPVRTGAGPAPAANSSPAAGMNTDPVRPPSNAIAPGVTPPGHQTTSSSSVATMSATAASLSASASPHATTGAADTGVSTSITAVGGRTPARSSGISTGTVVGACLLAFLLTIGAGTAWRQARARRQS